MSAGPYVPRVLRPKPWVFALVVTAATLFVAGAVSSYHHSGWTWTSLGFAGLAVLGIAGVTEVASTRIVLTQDLLEAGSVWSRRRYPVAGITSVTWEGGVGVSVKLSSGGWAKLPELGYNSQSLANTLRAWLKRVKAGAE